MVAIVGTGSVAARWLSAPADGTRRDVEDTAMAWHWLESAKLTAGAIGVRRGCAEGRSALFVGLNDWLTVDAAIRAIGAGLAADNLRGEVDVEGSSEQTIVD